MQILETRRLRLRELNAQDAAFILELVNEPAWLWFIGDRGIKTPEAAREYILNGPVEMYARHGFGLWLVERREAAVPIGICGLIRREGLDDIDLGFALLSVYRGHGYALEAAAATLAYAKSALGAARIVAITSPDNEYSRRLLEKLGFCFECMIRLPNNPAEVKLYAVIL